MRDMASRIAPRSVVVPIVATTTPTVASVDLRGFQSATFVVQVGAGGITFTGTNKLELILEHSDDNSTWSAVTAPGDVIGKTSTITGGIVDSWVAAKAAASIHEYGYVGGKRYARLTPTFGGTHATGTAVAVMCALGDADLLPAA